MQMRIQKRVAHDLYLMFMKWVLKLYSMYIREQKMMDGPMKDVNFLNT